MKKYFTIVFTLLVLLVLNVLVSQFTHTHFIDYSFFIGLLVTISIRFFTSTGGFTTRMMGMKSKSTVIDTEAQKFKFSPNIAFYTSFVYTVIMTLLTIYCYRSYF